MKPSLADRETVIELGLAIFAGALVGLLAILLYSRALGGTTRTQRHKEGPPLPGDLPGQRHENIQANPAR